MATKTTTPTENKTTKSKVVSVKLDSTQQTKLEQEAAEQGKTISEILRQKLDETKAETVATLPQVLAGTPLPTAATLDDATMLNIAGIVTKAVRESLPQSIEVSTPLEIAPEREYLRKIAGQVLESENTLTIEEETYLSNLKEAIEADVRETFLTNEKSILFPLNTENKLQVEMFEKMLERREATATEKLPTFTKVFQDAIAKAFFDNANSLYNSMLFKATYGFEYSEFKAVFEL